MKLLLYIANFFLLLFTCCSINAQSFAAKRYPERYSLEIPEDFKTPKFIEALTDLIPQKVDILKDKQFCMGCTGGYSARLVITKPVIKNKQCIDNGIYSDKSKSFIYSFTYSFVAYISILDSSYKRIAIIEILSPNEELYFSKQFYMPLSYDYYAQSTDSRGRMRYLKVPRPVDPWEFVNRNSRQFVLSTYELIEVVEQKVYELKHSLK